MIRRLAVALLCLMCVPGMAAAHDRDVATFVISPVTTKATADRPAVKGWMMEMHVPTAALHTALVTELGKAPVEALSKKAYKERAVDYLWRHIEMKTDTPVTLGGGGIKLGPHQTDLRFTLRRQTSQGERVGRPRDPQDDSSALSTPLGVGPPRRDSATASPVRLDRGRNGSRTHPVDFADDPLVWVKIDAFTEDGHQSNVLKVRGAKPRTVVLTAENNYAGVSVLKR